ncbi:hypothetical protein CC78DRAFT_463762 [Lojkania enalia]|uniref:Uncharacterized protein n=1 Tax=Lojkania enalia TaxID=147567 RepID=A0A9P4KDY4_9PLEO|nr:hypothetical protein CC78DRAFT_463762 [Didymosphaeria enalia]
MHQPQEPHYSFTIPSIHDDTTLDCRIYHPRILSAPKSQNNENYEHWKHKGIVMAHPYAPMGGSYDDRVVGIVVGEFLALGYVVGTFNFRGAHGSKGRTSWSGKPEVDDHISFAAFFMHYLSYLEPFPSPDISFPLEQSPVSQQTTKQTDISRTSTKDPAVVVLGGYSYGSLILKHLPPVPSILQPFVAPINGSAASEILLRAHRLADQSNLEWINLARDHEQRKKHGHENNLPVTMGGEETSPDMRRGSRELRRSMDGRRSLNVGRKMRSLSHQRRKDSNSQTPLESSAKKLLISMPNVKYLLVSPLTPPISTLAAPGLGYKFWNKSPHGCQEVIGKHVSLAIYGDQDIFTSTRKMQHWAEQLRSASDSRFSHVQVVGAGHFWHEHGVEEKLRNALKGWEFKIRDT